MAGEESLLERIRSGNIRRDPQEAQDASEVGRSVARNLERVFNSWCGSALVDEELGMPDDAYRQGSTEDIARSVSSHLVRNAKVYEPRLRDVRVRAVGIPESHGDQWLFELQGRLTDASRSRVLFRVHRDAVRYRVEF